MNRKTKGKSFRARLLQICILVVLLPITVVSAAFGINSTRIIRSGMEELAASDMVRTLTSIRDGLSSYQDILYQLFMDEDIIALTEKLDNQQDLAVTRNQLRRKLAEYLYAKDYIKSITIISDGGEVVFYDSLVTSNQKNSWMSALDMGQEELYNLLSGDNAIHYLPTSPAGNFAGKENYLFHMGRRIINYQDVAAQYGVVILSVDEAMLRGLCTAGSSNPERPDSFYFLVDGDGRVLSYPDKAYLTRELPVEGLSQEERQQVYLDFALETGLAAPGYVSVQVEQGEALDWDLVQVSNGNQLETRLLQQMLFMFVILMVALCLLLISLWLATGNLSRSVRQIVGVMEQVQEGKMFERVEMDPRMPREIQEIGIHYNQVMDLCVEAIENELRTAQKLRNAEILALESQINPHFIYNTLDTISWMAIGKEDYEVSDAISAFAKILRYSCTDSNGVVTIREELAWLGQYIVLQKLRLNDQLECQVDVPEELLSYRIHKLLLQPFVENAVCHGFKGCPRPPKLWISMEKQGKNLCIDIRDNGVGMPEALVEAMNRGEFPKSHTKSHVGLDNVISRIRLYYGKKAMVSVNSGPDLGTEIIITLPEEEVLPE